MVSVTAAARQTAQLALAEALYGHAARKKWVAAGAAVATQH